MADKLSQLLPNGFYHVYNRANGDELLFRNEDNFYFFLEKFKLYISPYVDVFSYCLLNNHFHFLLKIKTEKHIIRTKSDSSYAETSQLISRQFLKLFSCYTQSYNKVFNRRGSLFMKPFKRIHVKDEKYLRKLIHYIHYNPVIAGICTSPTGWKFSSYNSILGKAPTMVKKNEVIELFGDLENFIYCHNVDPSISGIE